MVMPVQITSDLLNLTHNVLDSLYLLTTSLRVILGYDTLNTMRSCESLITNKIG